MRSIALATTNVGKLTEMRRILIGLNFELVSLEELFRNSTLPTIAETGRTFQDNALIKARKLVDLVGIAAIADDSGLEVDSLGGAPGVRSARYAGESATSEENVVKLLTSMQAYPDAARRTARFRCAIALVDPWSEPRELVWEGACEGSIVDTPRGSDGFGYDPVFLPSGEARTMAELSANEKDAISHRSAAMVGLRKHLASMQKAPAPR